MPQLPTSVVEHLQESLLGRTRLRLFREIAGKDNWFPSGVEQRRWIREELRRNWAAGLMFANLLSMNRSKTVAFSSLPSPVDLTSVLARLDQNPVRQPLFLEVTGAPNPWPAAFGALIGCEDLDPEGLVYVITLIDKDRFPDGILTRIEVRASASSPEPAFSVLRAGGYVRFSRSRYRTNQSAVIAARLLAFAETLPRGSIRPLNLGAEEMTLKKGLVPPSDAVCSHLLNRLHKGLIHAHKAIVPLDRIRAHDLDFALSYPEDVIRVVQRDVAMKEAVPLLVYWKSGHFVMSDDYAHYLAYKAMALASVPVTILGSYPIDLAAPIDTGGVELLPPPWIQMTPDLTSLPEGVKEWLLEDKLRNRPHSAPSDLVEAFLSLARALQDERLVESDFQEILASQAVALEPFAKAVVSELRLGSDYRVDLAIRLDSLTTGALLVELERPDDAVFTRNGRLRAKVVHAVQQVQDWLRWWRENPDNTPAGFRADLEPIGLVVIGRNRFLSTEQRRRLQHLNLRQQVQIVTYDELLDRLSTLIANFETD